MYTQSPNVRSRFTTDPEDAQMPVIVKFIQLALMDCPDAELPFYGRDEWRPLEECAGEGFQSARKLGFTTWQLVVKAYHADVFFPSSLLGFDETCRTIKTDN